MIVIGKKPSLAVRCDNEGCPAFVDVGHEVDQKTFDEFLIKLGWTITIGTMRIYHHCIRHKTYTWTAP